MVPFFGPPGRELCGMDTLVDAMALIYFCVDWWRWVQVYRVRNCFCINKHYQQGLERGLDDGCMPDCDQFKVMRRRCIRLHGWLAVINHTHHQTTTPPYTLICTLSSATWKLKTTSRPHISQSVVATSQCLHQTAVARCCYCCYCPDSRPRNVFWSAGDLF